MEYTTRSLSACLRCRKHKLKCGGPASIPCQRCRASDAECIFTPPKLAQSSSRGRLNINRPQAAELENKVNLLEQRLQSVAEELRSEICQLRDAQVSLETTTAELSDRGLTVEQRPAGATGICGGLVSDKEWDGLYSFYYRECRNVIGFLDDQLYPPRATLKRHRLMSTVICSIASRAMKPELYQALMAHAECLIAGTFHGAPPDFLSFMAMILYVAWTGSTRLLGYVTSIASELKLDEAARSFSDFSEGHTRENVEHARGWLTLSCLDLQINLSCPFAIERIERYLPHATALLSSPFCVPADHRICTFLEGYAIAVEAKSQLQRSQLQEHPLRPEVAALLTLYDQRTDKWFHEINNKTNPLYQTFREQQDRNRYMIPYAYIKISINGLALYGMEVPGYEEIDDARLAFIEKALDSANLLIQTQFESKNFRRQFRFTIDYNGRALFQACNFMLKAVSASHRQVDCSRHLASLGKAAQIFDKAEAPEAATDIRKKQESLAALLNADSPHSHDLNDLDASMSITDLFDIPRLFNDPTSLSSYVEQ